MSAEENKKHVVHYCKVKCVLCGKVGFSADKKALARHLKLAHNRKYFEGLYVDVADDTPLDIKPRDKITLKSMVNKIKNERRRKENELTGAKHKKNKRKKSVHKSIYWGAVIKTAFETKR